jgi:hypothetical protein
MFSMPRQDGTGPDGKGAKTGRGLGPCKPGSKTSKSKSKTKRPMDGRGKGRGRKGILGQDRKSRNG